MFIKYPSLTNHYQAKAIDWIKYRYPQVADMLWVVREKIHGANVQFMFENKKFMGVATRNGVQDNTFYGIGSVLPEYQYLINEFCTVNYSHINLFGEFFGRGIQKGVNYGEKKQFRFFGIAVDRHYISPRQFEGFMLGLGFDHLIVPFIEQFHSLDDAVKFNVEGEQSRLYPQGYANGDNQMEGVVLMPDFFSCAIESDESMPWIKIKSERFSEKAAAKKRQHNPKAEMSDKAQDLAAEFATFITPNRLNNVFSKEGPIDNPKDIGKYIKLMLDDAKAEFNLDFKQDLIDLTKPEIKFIFNASNLIVPMLKESLNS